MAQPNSSQAPTAEGDRIPLAGKLGYSAGGMSVNLMANGVAALASMVLNIKLGMSPVLVGLLMALPRLYDAFSGPVIGIISDNISTRWGRRRPFMLVGGIGAGIFFAALWWLSPSWSEMENFWYFLAVSLIFYTFADLFSVSWGALGLGMTADYHERTRLMTINTFFSSFLMIGLAWIYSLTLLPVFSDSLVGTKVVSAGVGLLIIVLSLGSVAFCKEKNLQTQGRPLGRKFRDQIKSVLTNRPFLILSTVVLLMCLGIFSIMSLGNYVAIYYVHGGNQKAGSVLLGWSGTVWQASSLLWAVVIGPAAVRFGKKQTLACALALTAIGSLLKWPCASPQHPWLFVIPSMIIAAGFCALWTLTASMLADVCDDEELRTGQRNEGTLNAMYWWLNKLGVSAAFAISGILLNLTGFDQARGGAQSPDAISMMRLLDAGIPALTIIGAILLIRLYPITEARAAEIRKLLEGRRGQMTEV